MSFASVEELQNRLEWDLDASEERIAQGALDDLSADALFYGNPRWTEDTLPVYVKTLILKAAQRYMRNPDGYETSRAGDEMLGWGERPGMDSGSASFSEQELQALRQLVRPRVFGSLNVQAYGTRFRPAQAGSVPAARGEKPFPYYPTTDGPW